MANAVQKETIVKDGVLLELTQEEANFLRDLLGNIGGNRRYGYSIFISLQPLCTKGINPFTNIPQYDDNYEPAK